MYVQFCCGAKPVTAIAEITIETPDFGNSLDQSHGDFSSECFGKRKLNTNSRFCSSLACRYRPTYQGVSLIEARPNHTIPIVGAYKVAVGRDDNLSFCLLRSRHSKRPSIIDKQHLSTIENVI